MKLRSGGYANVASTLALIVALGGTSYAAVAIPKNSVGSQQIVNGSVSSKDVKNGNLKAVDFKAGELPAGARGPAGPAGAAGPVGPQGPMGPSNAYSMSAGILPTFWDGSGTEQTVGSLSLPAGSYAFVGKVMANNSHASASADVSCTLKAGGATVDTSGSVEVDAEPGMDRAFITLTGTTTLATPGTATLACTSTAGVTGAYNDRGLVAVKVASIS